VRNCRYGGSTSSHLGRHFSSFCNWNSFCNGINFFNWLFYRHAHILVHLLIFSWYIHITGFYETVVTNQKRNRDNMINFIAKLLLNYRFSKREFFFSPVFESDCAQVIVKCNKISKASCRVAIYHNHLSYVCCHLWKVLAYYIVVSGSRSDFCDFYIFHIETYDSFVARRIESIASIRSTDFNVRFARSENQLEIFALRQIRGIVAANRNTREAPRESNFFVFDCRIFEVLFGIQII